MAASNSASNYFIVSCDGGGVRGLITAMLLENLEAQCPGFLSNVALFAGTSTGGIIALGLASGIPISTIRERYETNSQTIFTPFHPDPFELLKYIKEYVDELLEPSPTARARPTAEGLPSLTSTLQTLEEVFHVKYKADGLSGMLHGLLPTNPMLSQSRPVLVTTYNIAPLNGPSWRPLLLTNLPSPHNVTVPVVDASDIPVIDAALATSAAPTFFPPFELDSIGYCADGGIFANNPSLFALSAAIVQNHSADNIWMLSLGTGAVTQKVNLVADPLAWGMGQWVLPKQTKNVPQMLLLQTLMDGQEEIADSQCAALLGSQYQRVDIQLSELFPLDGVQYIPQIVQETQAYINGQPITPEVTVWQDVVNWVKAILKM